MDSYAELKKKNAEELNKELEKIKLELIKLNAQASTGASSKEAGKIKIMKRQIARIKTLQKTMEAN